MQDDGLSFNVEVGQTVLARAHLHHANNFLAYAYKPPPEQLAQGRQHTAEDSDGDTSTEQRDPQSTSPRMLFEISLSALLNCLNIFGDSTVKPVGARQMAARERWRKRRRDDRDGGNEYGYGDGDGNGNEDAGDNEEDEERTHARAGNTTYGKKKGATAMVMTWEAEGCPLVLLCVSYLIRPSMLDVVADSVP